MQMKVITKYETHTCYASQKQQLENFQNDKQA